LIFQVIKIGDWDEDEEKKKLAGSQDMDDTVL
jgi:hypothetical protein